MQQNKGPAQQFYSQLIQQDNNKKVFQTNQKYAEYLAYLGQSKPPITAYTKLAQWKQYQFDETTLLLDPSKISPLLSAYADENKQLKNECFKLSNDIIQLTIMTERLIDDNLTIKKHLELKTNELQHFLQTQQLQINDEISDLRLQIQSLQDENNILIKHLEEMRRNTNEEVILNLEIELNNAKELNQQQLINFQMCQEREYDLGRELQKLKPLYQDALEKIIELSSTLTGYEDSNHTLNNQVLLLTNKIDLINKQKQDILISKQMEQDTQDLKNNSLITENQTLRDQILIFEQRLQELQRDNLKLSQENQQFKLISDELLNKGRDIKNQLELEKLKKQPQPSHEEITKEQLILECRRLREQLDRAQLEYLKLDDFMSKQLASQKQSAELIIDNMKTRYTISLDEKYEQISLLEQQVKNHLGEINIQKKEYQILQNDFQTLQQKQEDQSQLKKIVDQQIMEIRILKGQLTDKKMLVNEMIEEKEKLGKLIKSEQQSKQQDIYLLEQEKKSIQNDIQKQQYKLDEFDRILKKNEELEQQILQIQQSYKEVQQLCRDETSTRQNLQVETGIQANQIGVLKEQIRYYQEQQQRKDKLEQVLQENQILRAQLK